MDVGIPKMDGYNFEYVTTPLSAGGVGMFINDSLDYLVLEKIFNDAFQALWIELSFPHKKSIVCEIVFTRAISKVF